MILDSDNAEKQVWECRYLSLTDWPVWPKGWTARSQPPSCSKGLSPKRRQRLRQMRTTAEL